MEAMSPIAFTVYDVFTDRPFTGNQLAIIDAADDLDDQQMLAITREFGFSESAFLQRSEAPAVSRVRIFTTRGEIPFAGHPTIGVGIHLAAMGQVKRVGNDGMLVLDEGVGPVSVAVQWDGDAVVSAMLTAPRAPILGPAGPLRRSEIAELLGISARDVIDSPRVASCGSPVLVVPVRSLEVLGHCRLSIDRWVRFCEPIEDLRSLYVVADVGSEIRARMFAPHHGVMEDPATGSAAVALTGLLALGRADGTHAWTIRQGVEMGRPSELVVEADVEEGRVVTARVGGSARKTITGAIAIPESSVGRPPEVSTRRQS